MINHVDSAVVTPAHSPTTSGAEPAGAGHDADDRRIFEQRQHRIQRHLLDSLEHEDTRISIIGTVSADVMLLQLQVGAALRETLGPGRADPDVLSRNREGLEMVLKLSKLGTQIFQVQRKMRGELEALHNGETES